MDIIECNRLIPLFGVFIAYRSLRLWYQKLFI